MKRFLVALCFLLFFYPAYSTWAADGIMVSNFPTLPAPNPATDYVPVVSGGVNYKSLISSILGIGSTTQAYDADLSTFAGLSVAEGLFLIGDSTPAWSVSAYTLPLTIGTEAQQLRVKADLSGLEFATPFDPDTPGEIGGITPAAATFTSVNITGTDGDYKLGLSNNSVGRAATVDAWELYVDAGVWKVNTNGTETTMATSTTVPTLQSGSGAITVTAKNAYVVCTGACQITLPTPAAGAQVCARNVPGSATAITLNNQTGVYYEKPDHSTYGTANYKLVSGGLATDSICLVGLDATHYLTFSSSGTWTDTAP